MSKITYTHLRDICDVNQGLQIPIDKRFKELKENRYFYITVQFLKDSYLEKYYVENPTKSTICEEDDILVVRTGNTGQIITGIKGCFHNNFFKVNFDKTKLNSKYLYYCLTTKEKQYEMAKRAGITTIPDLNHFMFLDMQIPLQSKENQDSIVNLLDSLNSKIELNNKINKELETMAKTLYDYWFVQFDFPDENGKPYKSSGGKMVYSKELKREIPEGWEVNTLNKMINCLDSKRIPLSKKQRENRRGNIPYYGATSVMDYIDDFIFDGEYILLAEDGSTMDQNGNPILQYIWNKTWVNNHAHILEAKEQKNLEFIFHTLKKIAVVKIETGSIQKKINQENLLNVKIIIPSLHILDKFSEIVKPIRKRLINNIEQNQELAKLRDWLLPMLMNGQVSVK